MEDWPVDSRVRNPPPVATRRQGPPKIQPELSWDTPIIDGGVWSSSRISLNDHQGSSRLSWVNINSPDLRISTGNTRCIFPPTRDISSPSDGLSFERRVLSVNAWLRSHKGVDDLEAIFLREILEDNEDYVQNVMDYDPYCSDLLAIDFLTKGHKKRAGIIAYPMGQNFDLLGASVLFDEKWGTVFSPAEKPGWKAPAPILQIIKSNAIYKPSPTSYTHAGCLFAIRTLFDINFISIAPKPGAAVVAKQSLISSFGQADIGSHRPFDLAFNPYEQTHAGLVVSDIGAVWIFGLDSKPSLLYSQTDDKTTRVGAYDLPYWGLRWGTHPERFMLGSRTMLRLYDKRISRVVSSLPMTSEALTSFDTLQNESCPYIFVSGTEHVTLVDERMIGRPVVSWAHHRDRDMTLRIKALELEQKRVGLLTSKRSSFISVYDPFLSEGGSLECCDSYGLDWDCSNTCIPASIAAYIPPTTARPTLFHLSNSGAIYRQDLGIGPCEPSVERVVWDHELKNLAEKVELEHEEYHEQDLTKYRKVNLRSKYERIFMNSNPEAGGPSVTEVTDLTPTVFQRANEPIDKPVILHDLVRMISQEATSALPRSFFASTRSLPLPKARLLLKHVAHIQSQSHENVSWSYDLSNVQGHIWPALVPIPTADDLIAFSVLDNVSENASKRDKEARQEIALDLALSMTVYSSIPFQPSRLRLPPPVIRDDDDILSVAASALTLGGIEPPHVQHVQPCPTQGLVDGKQGAEQRQSLVARLLASEWDPDSSPTDYEFHDPYNEDYDESMPAWKLMAQTKADKQTLERAKSRFLSSRATIASPRSVPLPSIQISRNKPPVIPNPVAVRGIRQAKSQPELVPDQTTSSQPREALVSQMSGSSQMPSTQIVPGAFGARPGTGAVLKKKKSRLPGF
ncbi:hypothetical protein OPQ81_009929 [Rhizoctonia solani]|nr:hypothetical protein OPQ81_009929 [Rhizoctonia solani]